MEWIRKKLIDDYELVGNINENVIQLIIEHPKGQKIIQTKHMTQIDFDNCDFDNIRRYFSRPISKIETKTLEQLQLLCK